MPLGLSLYENEPPEHYRLVSWVATCIPSNPDPLKRPVILAVSGGGDSVAMLRLAQDVASRYSCGPLVVVTVDHDLRPASASEAGWVGRLCATLDVPHTVLRWEGDKGQGNLQDRARRARYGLLADHAKKINATGVVLGHTMDDQAETFLMQLSRSAGLAGLAAMQPWFHQDGVRFSRPMLHLRRAELRDYLTGIGQDWIDDPSNDDDRFHRIRLRKAMPMLADLGLTVEAITGSMQHIGAGDSTINLCLRETVAARVTEDRGDLILAADALSGDLRHRFWQLAPVWVSGGRYPPRATAMRECFKQAYKSGSATIAGCLISHDSPGGLPGGTDRISREYAAVQDLTCPTTDIWDSRWALDGPHGPDLHIGALGGAVSQCPNWRETGLPRTSFLASPAIWQGETLVAAPLAGFNPDWTARIVADFNSFLQSH